MRIVDVGHDLGPTLLELASGLELELFLASAKLNRCVSRVSLVTISS